MALRSKIYLFNVSSVRVIKGAPPAPTELKKKNIEMLWNASFIKTPMHVLLRYLRVHACARGCMWHVRQLQRQMQFKSAYYVLHKLFTSSLCFSTALTVCHWLCDKEYACTEPVGSGNYRKSWATGFLAPLPVLWQMLQSLGKGKERIEETWQYVG